MRSEWHLLLALFLLVTGCDEQKVHDGTQGMSSVCSVHGVQMHVDLVPTQYGLPGLTPYLQAQYSLFPNARDFCHMCMCMPIEDGLESARVFVCPQCLRAKDAWLDKSKEQENSQPVASPGLPKS